MFYRTSKSLIIMKKIAIISVILFVILIIIAAYLFVASEDKAIANILLIIGLVGEIISIVLVIVKSKSK